MFPEITSRTPTDSENKSNNFRPLTTVNNINSANNTPAQYSQPKILYPFGKNLASSKLATTNYEFNTKNVLKSFAFRTKTGKNPLKPTKSNQDSYICLLNYLGSQNQHLFGIFDGHGFFGGQASEMAKKRLPANIEHFSGPLKLLVKDQPTRKSILISAFDKTHNEMLHSNMDSTYSGCTACLIVLLGDTLVCANVGDSRAILIGPSQNTALSLDHKPALKHEYERIVKAGGRVEPCRNSLKTPIGPHRVWKKVGLTPGLAMSRSLGDKAAHRIGVIAEPDVRELKIEGSDKCVVIGSDGLWEFVSNSRIGEIAMKYEKTSDAEGACEEIIKEASNEWEKRGPTQDDITVIVIYLNI